MLSPNQGIQNTNLRQNNQIFANMVDPTPESVLANYPQPCVFHHGNIITNFCTEARCLMPLCPQCIKIHLDMHEAKR